MNANNTRGIDVAALVAACTGSGMCPFADTNFRCPQTIECKYTKASNWTKHIENSTRIREALQKRFPLK